MGDDHGRVALRGGGHPPALACMLPVRKQQPPVVPPPPPPPVPPSDACSLPSPMQPPSAAPAHPHPPAHSPTPSPPPSALHTYIPCRLAQPGVVRGGHGAHALGHVDALGWLRQQGVHQLRRLAPQVPARQALDLVARAAVQHLEQVHLAGVGGCGRRCRCRYGRIKHGGGGGGGAHMQQMRVGSGCCVFPAWRGVGCRLTAETAADGALCAPSPSADVRLHASDRAGRG